MVLKASDESAVDGERKLMCGCLKKSSQNGHCNRGWHNQLFKRYFGHVVREERGMENDVSDARGDEWEEKASEQ